MQILPLTLRHDGFELRQLVRDDHCAIYQQFKGERLNSYEVIIIQTHKAHTWPNGTTTEAGEHYPSSRQWGQCGWTFKALELAHAKLDELQRTVHAIGTEEVA